MDAATWKIKYRERLFSDKHRSTPVAADGEILIAGRKGTVFVVKAGPQLKVLSENELDEQITASPSVSKGRIFIRSQETIYAFGVE